MPRRRPATRCVHQPSALCVVATTITWISGASLEQAPARRTEYAHADLRRVFAHDLADVCLGVGCGDPATAPEIPSSL
ncbi:MAG: hypothetical protein KFB96_07755 [Thiocapsa sp.]|uniref:hypothetical protein n=1 Tax=Thiocapsa sp. TaxID=2024551 RepID=UPI001BCD6666|nr:hypothetical protein [Thiocapsa sp.]QVL50320.1 MAG: hypothetical protein KFB96_07755 [Thiocapsa sp.]